MAPPRFGATGRRFRPRIINAGQLPTGTILDANRVAATRPVLDARNLRLPAGQTLLDAGRPPNAFKEIGSWYDRPLSVLGGVARVLSIGENAAVGLLQSFVERGRDIRDDPISPWVWLKAVSQVPAFIEMGEAIKENRTFEQWIEESADPDSFLYKNKFIIGLGLSIVGDPTTYLTLGATGASKVAAQKVLQVAAMSTAHEAQEVLAGAVIKQTGKKAADFDNNFDEIFHYIHQLNARPYTPTDALEFVRKVDRGEVGNLDENLLTMAGVKSRGPVKAAVRKRFARGGQGLRFAGMEIPGTRRPIGRGIDAIPGPDARDLQNKLYETFHHVIPRAKLRTLTEDMTRAVAMLEFPRANLDIAAEKRNGWHEALAEFQVDPEKAARLQSNSALAQGAAGIRNIFRTEKTPAYVPLRDRKGLFKHGPRTGPYYERLKELESLAFDTRRALLDEAVELGMDEQQVRTFERFWDELVEQHDDPVDVLARWQASVQGNIMGLKVMDGLLRNPLLARPLIEGAEEMATLERQWRSVQRRSQNAARRANEKGISSQERQARMGNFRILQQESQELQIQLERVKASMKPLDLDEAEVVDDTYAVKHLTDLTGEANPRAVGQVNQDEYGDMLHEVLSLAGATEDEAMDAYARFSDLAVSEDPTNWEDMMKLARISLRGEGDKLTGTAKGRGLAVDKEAAKRWFQEDAIPYKHRGTTYLVPHAVEQALDQIKNPQVIDKELSKLFRSINFTQNKWKILATSLNPAFHVMNAVGAMWNNMLGGVYNPVSYTKTWAELMQARIARWDEESMLGRVTQPIRGRMDMENVNSIHRQLDDYEARHAGGGFVPSEAHPEYQQFLKESRPSGRLKTSAKTAARLYGGFTVAGTLAPDDWVPDAIEDNPLFNPWLGTAALLGTGDLTRAGRFAANEVETTVRLTPIRKALKDPSYWQMLDGLSVSMPADFGRWMGQMPIGKEAFMREQIFDIGAMNAIRYQFDYTDLTNFERYAAKTIFPFYVFNKNNFVLQLQELVTRPRFVATAVDIANYFNATTETDQNLAFQEFVPEYFDKLGMFRIPVPGPFRAMLGLPEDQDLYLNPRLPFASLNLFPPLWQVFQDDSVTPTTSRWLQVLAPLFASIGPAAPLPIPGIKPLLEYSIGVNLGLARPIDYQRFQSGGWRNSYREAPAFFNFVPGPLRDVFGVFKDGDTGKLMMNASLAYITESMATPFMNSTGDVFNWAGGDEEQDRVRANTFAFMTGIRLTPVDPLRLQRGWLYRMENFLEGHRGDLRAQGKDLSPEDSVFLKRIRWQIKSVERAWDAKQEELYGKSK